MRYLLRPLAKNDDSMCGCTLDCASEKRGSAIKIPDGLGIGLLLSCNECTGCILMRRYGPVISDEEVYALKRRKDHCCVSLRGADGLKSIVSMGSVKDCTGCVLLLKPVQA